ncbi:hypothetical protein [Rhizobium sp. 2MFCol3.1]|jgi:hypothetical protein|uniref:hypothetical protein n=2 Tax=Rhizobium TaxID=379 RepID=UPI0003697156|nr:hypothetical protein [Rhizobium sp. 2MFCol3.1]
MRKQNAMQTSHNSPPAVLAAAVIAGSLFLIQQQGFFHGAFTSEILASINAEDVLVASDYIATSNSEVAGGRVTATAH